MARRCLVVADDLTGAIDTGAQFARRGLRTLLILGPGPKVDLSGYPEKEVLVVSTHSRGLPPEKASLKVSLLFENYHKDLFPVIYKKIDSTLRGNIGYEVDAILEKAGISTAFLTPAFPEQGRVVVGGIHLVKGTPLSLTEISRDAVSPVKESCVRRLLEKQSRRRIGPIDLVRVASGGEALKQAVEGAVKRGIRVLTFDAVTREDVARIGEAAFRRKETPLFVGSAGLAEEVAKKLASEKPPARPSSRKRLGPSQHVFIVSGSASKVSHEQLRRAEEGMKIPSFQIDRSFLGESRSWEEDCTRKVSRALMRGAVILRVAEERMFSTSAGDLTLPLKITGTLGRLAASVLERAALDVHSLVVVLIGGDTALSVLNRLKAEEVEIQGEVLNGIGIGQVAGGRWDGLRLVTKAGGFGRENALEKILKILQPSSRRMG